MRTWEKLLSNAMALRAPGRWPIIFSVICLLATSFSILPPHAQQPPVPAHGQSSLTPSQAFSPAQEKRKAKSFASPEDAAGALCAAARKNDDAELLVILGPDGKDLVTWSTDAKERERERAQFAQKYDQMHRLVKEPDNTVTLYVGAENWPLPIPIVEYNGEWYFDAALGKQEILYRRIGRNEVEALEVCHALIDAEKEYFASAHAYTAKFVSTDDSHDGLYWKSTNAAQSSPIGPYLAYAGVSGPSAENRQPYHGYYYRILLPGTVAPDGDAKKSAEDTKGNSGFVIVAFPAEYRSCGVMTFLMDENGNAYEKDLGPTTSTLVRQITSFQPDNTWQKVE